MIYHSVADIFDSINETRVRFYERVAGLQPAQENFRPTPDTWSVGELIEHVSHVDHQIVQLVSKMLAKAGERASSSSSSDGNGGNHPMTPFSFDDYIERGRSEKYQAPERAHPRGGVPVADSLARMRETRERLRGMIPLLDSADLSGISYPHPAFGPLDPYQWLVLIGVHDERHLLQLDALMQMPEFKSLDSELN